MSLKIILKLKIKNLKFKRKGQSLMEILVALAVGSILIGGSATLMALSLRNYKMVKEKLAANSILHQGTEIVQALGRGNWHDIADLTPGVHYKITKQNNSYALHKGEEKYFLDDSPVAYWGFDEATSTIAYDNSSNTNNGTLTNGPTWQSSSNCVSGSCLSFDTSAWKYVEASDSASTDIRTNLTLEAWIYPTGSGGSDAMSTIIVSSGGYYLSFNDSVNALSCYWYGKSPAGYHTTANATIQLNQWNHIACVWDATTLKQYINGSLLKTTNVTGNGTGSTSIRIGAESSARQLSGLIDESRIYNRALSADEIGQHYKAGLDKLGLVSYWAMDENGGTTAYDSQSTNNGTLTNGPTWTLGNDCVSGGCLSFDGVDDYVEVASNGQGTFDNQQFTVSAWVKNNIVTGDRVVFSYDNTSHANPYYGTHMRFSGTTLYFMWNNGATYRYINYTKSDLTAGIWYHIVGTYKSGEQKLYIDGVEVANTTKTDTITFYNQEVWIGKGNFGGYFKGLIDEVRIFNRILSAEEIGSRYQAGYTRYMVLNKVSRSSGNIETTYNSANDDPATLKISSILKYGQGIVSNQGGGVQQLNTYLTRSEDNKTFAQTDWSGGSGQAGPVPNPSNKYDSASNVDDSTTGQITMATTTSDGILTSSILDTGVINGAGFNSLLWQGTLVASSTVGFQIAFSTSSTDTWTYYGPTATSDWYQPNPNISTALPTTGAASSQNMRYIRYKVKLSTTGAAPTVNDIIINWSP